MDSAAQPRSVQIADSGAAVARRAPLRSAAAALLLALFTLACSSVQVTTDFEPGADFSAFQTYAWWPEGPPPASEGGRADPRYQSPLADARVRRAVDQQLAVKGFRKAAAGEEPDIFVNYHLSIESKMDVYTVNRYYGYGWGIGVPETRTVQYDEGTLVIDVGDRRRKQLVWRGVGRGRVRDNPSREQLDKDVDQAVMEILAGFPPTPKAGG